jgi:hypothetical protein
MKKTILFIVVISLLLTLNLALAKKDEKNPKSTERIIELLTEGAGNSGKVPKGLENAPGIEEKLEGIDYTAPIISDVRVTIVSATTTITWITDEDSTSVVYLGTSSGIYLDVVTGMATSVTATSSDYVHEVQLNNLLSSTTYYFVVESVDGSGNIAVSSEDSFNTPIFPSDYDFTVVNSYPHIIEGYNFIVIYDNCPEDANVEVGLLMGEASDSYVDNGNLEGILGVISYGNCSQNGFYARNGYIRAMNDWLTPSTNYNYQIVFFTPETSYWPGYSASHFPEINFPANKVYTEGDKANELHRFPPGSFTTLDTMDTTPPNFTIWESNLTSNSITIIYSSDDFLTGSNLIYYDTNVIDTSDLSPYSYYLIQDQDTYLDNTGFYYRGEITGLSPGTTYHYRVRGNSQASSGGIGGYLVGYSDDETFTTLP